MNRHLNAHFLAHRNHGIQEILVIIPQHVRRNALILLQCLLQLSQPLRLPSRKGKSVAVLRRLFHDLKGSHIAQLSLVIIQAVGTVLLDNPRQVRAEPVKHRHKIVHDHLNAILGQVADGGDIVGNILIPGGKPHLNVLMDIHALDDFALQPCLMNLVHILFNLFLRPHLACRFVIKNPHKAAHAGNLPDLLQCDGITVGPIPAECHFHMLLSPFFLNLSQVYLMIPL